MFKTLVHLILYARETKCNDFINSVVEPWRGKGSGVVGRERMGTAFPHKILSGNGVPTR